MFQWDKSINAINLSADKVVNLFRSMREVQLALPGVPAQEASAFLCQYQWQDGIGTVAVFHLHKSQLLAFYYSDPRIVTEQKIDSMLDQGLNFVESMGFLMTDQDLHLLENTDQEMLWASLPLKGGLPDDVNMQTVVTPDVKTVAARAAADATVKQEAPAKKANSKVVKKKVTVVEPEKAAKKAESEVVSGENVDDLLAAVEAMRAKRPGLRARKLPPSEKEMARRRLQLRETVGHILASL